MFDLNITGYNLLFMGFEIVVYLLVTLIIEKASSGCDHIGSDFIVLAGQIIASPSLRRQFEPRSLPAIGSKVERAAIELLCLTPC